MNHVLIAALIVIPCVMGRAMWINHKENQKFIQDIKDRGGTTILL